MATPSNTVKIVFQALPSPADGGEKATPGSILSPLINLVQTAPSEDGPRWLTVIHSLPANFSANKIPTSPPVTPGGTYTGGGAQDYFNLSHIIHNAVITVDRYAQYGPDASLQILRSPEGSLTPGLCTPPSSTNYAIYERFLPPATPREYLDLFDTNSSSAMTDRARELMVHGNLLVVYPTRAGAETFAFECLGPVLDPVLRSASMTYRLGSDLAREISRIPSTRYMLSFEDLEKKVTAFARRMSPSGGQHGQTSRPAYEVKFAKKATVPVPSRTWEHWWSQQESARVKHLIQRFYGEGGVSLDTGSHVSAAGIAREILEGVEKRVHSLDVVQPEADIEVGVFVITRTR